VANRIVIGVVGVAAMALAVIYLVRPDQWLGILRRGPGARGEPKELPGCVRVGFCLLLLGVGALFLYKAVTGPVVER
jgi:hypothetical protein